MQEKNISRAKIVLNALKKNYGLKTYGQLADMLGVKQNTLSSWINRDSLDENLIYRRCDGVSYNFLVSGEGEAFPNTKVAEIDLNNYSVKTIHEGLTPEEAEALRIMRECPEAKSIVKMLADMDRGAQKEIQARVEEKKLLLELMKERQEKKAG